MIATIPMASDVAELIGASAERVENRSLLLDKFVFHKKWPVLEEQNRRGRDLVKWDEANRWSFVRIADRAEQILRREAKAKRDKANGRNTEPENRPRYEAEARIAEALAGVKWDTEGLQDLRSRHTIRFLSLFRGAYGERASIIIGQLEGRLAINLADSLIQNAGICLDRLFGLPYIPGSAIKGVSRHAALAELKAASDGDKPRLLQIFSAVFGTSENDFKNGDLKPFRHSAGIQQTDRKGAVSFLPAYPVNEAKIVVDLTNVHYPDYYRTGRVSDLANEKPQPNPFPAVETGAQFAFCVVLNGLNQDAALLTAAARWLSSAITERGLGAKTAAGYGWFSLQPKVLEELEAKQRAVQEAQEQKEKATQDAERAEQEEAIRKAGLSPESLAGETLLALNDEAFAAFGKTLEEKDEVHQRAFIHLLTSTKEKRERWKTWKKKKPDLIQSIEAVRSALNLPPFP